MQTGILVIKTFSLFLNRALLQNIKLETYGVMESIYIPFGPIETSVNKSCTIDNGELVMHVTSPAVVDISQGL
jgi:hypothetical protein